MLEFRFDKFKINEFFLRLNIYRNNNNKNNNPNR
jgi:hypothetical protein